MGWLIAGILLVLLLRTRHRLKGLIQSTHSATAPNTNRPEQAAPRSSAPSHRHIYNLIVLRLEMERLRAAEEINLARYHDVTQSIDTLLSNLMRHVWAAPQGPQWHQSCETAWDLLVEHQALSPEPPPWRCDEISAVTPEPKTQRQEAATAAVLTPPAHLTEAISQPLRWRPLRWRLCPRRQR